MAQYLLDILWSDDAATAVEYAVMLALILTAVISVIGAVGTKTGGLWGRNSSELTTHAF